ncbi:MAG: TRAP transporter substrate-binding protein [Rhodospirillales bacterium]|nr:TRAP transporter substrate-binding protein [Rhodospirillales bacterium]
MRIELKFCGYHGPNSIHTRAARAFGDALAGNPDADVDFHLQESILDLGRGSGDLIPMTAAGELTAFYISSIRFSDLIPEFRIFELPFMVTSREKVFAALDGDFGQMLKEKISDSTDFRVLGFWDNGFRHITNRVRPIRSPEDCKGIRFRTQMSDLPGEAFQAMGFEPVALDIKLLMDKIGSGEIEAQDNPLTSIYNFNIHKHHRYITLSGHIFGVVLMLCNRKAYQSWPEEVRRAVDGAAHEATALQRKLAAEQDAEMMVKLGAGETEILQLSEAERAAFIDAVAPVVERYRQSLDRDLFERFK